MIRRLFRSTTTGLEAPESFVHGCSDERVASTDANEHVDVAKLGIFQFDLDVGTHVFATLSTYR